MSGVDLGQEGGDRDLAADHIAGCEGIADRVVVSSGLGEVADEIGRDRRNAPASH